jgi:hypothetical protein
VSIRYSESLVKKIDQNPSVGYVKVAMGFLVGKVVGFYWFFY